MTHPIPIWGGAAPGFDQTYGAPEPTITPFLLERAQPGAAVIVFPGGGYTNKAAHEAAPIARWLNTLGLSAFVLDYRVSPYRHPIPLLDARRAVRLVRSRAAAWRIDPRRVGVLGFSAGGHLAATLGTQPSGPEEQAAGAVAELDARPDALILCYPVISLVTRPHVGSRSNLLGDPAGAAQVEALSAELRAGAGTPPAFLWHTANDASVPAEHSLLFAQALAAHGVPFELHVFPRGRHGLGLAEDDPQVGAWRGLCATWLRSIGFLEG